MIADEGDEGQLKGMMTFDLNQSNPQSDHFTICKSYLCLKIRNFNDVMIDGIEFIL